MAWTSTASTELDLPNGAKIYEGTFDAICGNFAYLKTSAIVLNAVSNTTANGVVTAFNISTGVAATSVAIYVNGIRRRPSSALDYTHVSGESHVDFVWAPATTDAIYMDYVAA